MIDDAFWQERSGRAGAYAQGYEGFDPRFAEALARMVQDWERQTGQRADFTSYGRTPEQGREIWERSGHGKNFLAAAPGKSRHEYDLEAGRRATAADIPRGDFLDWAHENAGEYGLEFLKGRAFERDPVHIQLAGGPSYSGGSGSGSYSGSGGEGLSGSLDTSLLRALTGGPLVSRDGGGSSEDGPLFDVSLLRAIGGGPLVRSGRGGDAPEIFGGSGGDNLIGGAYADSLGSGNDVQQTVTNTLASRGWQPGEIAAAWGNAAAESTHDPSAVNSSSGAVGLWQWLGDRKDGLMNFASELGMDWRAPEVQALYLDAERTGASAQYGGANEARNFAKAFSAGGIGDMVAGFANYVERASEGDIARSMARRMNGALSFLGGGDPSGIDMNMMVTPLSYSPPYSGGGPTSGPPPRGWSESAFPAFDTSPQWSVEAFPNSGPPAGSAVPDPTVRPDRPDPITTGTTETAMPYWNEPDFNELQGGSKHAYHFDRDTGRGVYRTSKGKLIAYDESGFSSPIGERHVDAFVGRSSPTREGGSGGRRISGKSTLGPASRDPVARALAEAGTPWPEEKAATGPFHRFRPPTGGPPPSALRDPGEITQLLVQLEATGDIYKYTTALKNYAGVLDTTPEVLNEMVKNAKFDISMATPPEGGPAKPPPDPDELAMRLASMSPASADYYELLTAGASAIGWEASQLTKLVEEKRKGGAIKSAADILADTGKAIDANTVAVAYVLDTVKLFGIPKTSPSYGPARAEVVRQLTDIIGLSPEEAERQLTSRGL